MASNKDLVKKILAINPDAKVAELNNAQLVAELKKLTAPPAPAPAPAPAAAPAPAPAPAAAPAPAPAPAAAAPAPAPAPAAPKAAPAKAVVTDSHVVKDGKSLMTKRGVLGPGDGISSRDVTGGSATLESLTKAGFISKA